MRILAGSITSLIASLIRKPDVLFTGALLGTKTASSPVAAVDDSIRIGDSDIVLVGLAVSWENRDAYYVALTDTAAKGLCHSYAVYHSASHFQIQ